MENYHLTTKKHISVVCVSSTQNVGLNIQNLFWSRFKNIQNCKFDMLRRVSGKKREWLWDVHSHWCRTTARASSVSSRVLPEEGPHRYSQSQTLSSLCVKEYLHQLHDTQRAQGTTADKGTWLRAPLKLEEVNEMLGGHRCKAAVRVSSGAGVSRVLRRGRRQSGHTSHIYRNSTYILLGGSQPLSMLYKWLSWESVPGWPQGKSNNRWPCFIFVATL